MHYDFALASYEEAVFCTKHYEPTFYWRKLRVNPDWYELFKMGCEL